MDKKNTDFFMKNPNDHDFSTLAEFLNGKSEYTLMLFYHFVNEFDKVGPITLHPAKTMIGIANSHKRIVYITQLGKNFIHVVFPFRERYEDNFCFNKIDIESIEGYIGYMILYGIDKESLKRLNNYM